MHVHRNGCSELFSSPFNDTHDQRYLMRWDKHDNEQEEKE